MMLMTDSWLRKLFQASAWLLAFAIVVLSLVPPSHRPVTNASHYFEHLAIFLATGFAFGMGYPNRFFAWATRLILFCSVIEIAQHWDPGRHARLSDFVVDAMAAWTGLGIAFATMSVISNTRSHRGCCNGRD
jgi:VanZ family protein